MTQEEKAIRYDEVKNKLSRFIAQGVDPLITRADVQDFFPELGESEGEKVRKVLIKFFSMGAKNNLHTDGIADKDIIAWLEKQGEKHPDPYNGISFEYNGHIWGMCARDNGVDISCDKHLIKHLEKQAEQKPADKVEPKFKVGDKIYLKQEYRMPDDDTPIANTVKEIRRVDDKHYRFDGSYIFIEDQDKYELVEQKPIEENKGNIGGISPKWSVEDEENFCSVYLDVKSARQNTVNSLSGELKEQEQKRMDEVISWLQSLKGRVQPKQEWSEDDEQHIDSLLKRLDALCRNKFERTRFAISEDRDWLKSLKERKGGKI